MKQTNMLIPFQINAGEETRWICLREECLGTCLDQLPLIARQLVQKNKQLCLRHGFQFPGRLRLVHQDPNGLEQHHNATTPQAILVSRGQSPATSKQVTKQQTLRGTRQLNSQADNSLAVSSRGGAFGVKLVTTSPGRETLLPPVQHQLAGSCGGTEGPAWVQAVLSERAAEKGAAHDTSGHVADGRAIVSPYYSNCRPSISFRGQTISIQSHSKKKQVNIPKQDPIREKQEMQLTFDSRQLNDSWKAEDDGSDEVGGTRHNTKRQKRIVQRKMNMVQLLLNQSSVGNGQSASYSQENSRVHLIAKQHSNDYSRNFDKVTTLKLPHTNNQHLFHLNQHLVAENKANFQQQVDLNHVMTKSDEDKTTTNSGYNAGWETGNRDSTYNESMKAYSQATDQQGSPMNKSKDQRGPEDDLTLRIQKQTESQQFVIDEFQQTNKDLPSIQISNRKTASKAVNSLSVKTNLLSLTNNNSSLANTKESFLPSSRLSKKKKEFRLHHPSVIHMPTCKLLQLYLKQKYPVSKEQVLMYHILKRDCVCGQISKEEAVRQIQQYANSLDGGDEMDEKRLYQLSGSIEAAAQGTFSSHLSIMSSDGETGRECTIRKKYNNILTEKISDQGYKQYILHLECKQGKNAKIKPEVHKRAVADIVRQNVKFKQFLEKFRTRTDSNGFNMTSTGIKFFSNSQYTSSILHDQNKKSASGSYQPAIRINQSSHDRFVSNTNSASLNISKRESINETDANQVSIDCHYMPQVSTNNTGSGFPKSPLTYTNQFEKCKEIKIKDQIQLRQFSLTPGSQLNIQGLLQSDNSPAPANITVINNQQSKASFGVRTATAVQRNQLQLLSNRKVIKLKSPKNKLNQNSHQDESQDHHNDLNIEGQSISINAHSPHCAIPKISRRTSMGSSRRIDAQKVSQDSIRSKNNLKLNESVKIPENSLLQQSYIGNSMMDYRQEESINNFANVGGGNLENGLNLSEADQASSLKQNPLEMHTPQIEPSVTQNDYDFRNHSQSTSQVTEDKSNSLKPKISPKVDLKSPFKQGKDRIKSKQATPKVMQIQPHSKEQTLSLNPSHRSNPILFQGTEVVGSQILLNRDSIQDISYLLKDDYQKIQDDQTDYLCSLRPGKHWAQAKIKPMNIWVHNQQAKNKQLKGTPGAALKPWVDYQNLNKPERPSQEDGLQIDKWESSTKRSQPANDIRFTEDDEENQDTKLGLQSQNQQNRVSNQMIVQGNLETLMTSKDQINEQSVTPTLGRCIPLINLNNLHQARCAILPEEAVVHTAVPQQKQPQNYSHLKAFSPAFRAKKSIKQPIAKHIKGAFIGKLNEQQRLMVNRNSEVETHARSYLQQHENLFTARNQSKLSAGVQQSANSNFSSQQSPIQLEILRRSVFGLNDRIPLASDVGRSHDLVAFYTIPQSHMPCSRSSQSSRLKTHIVDQNTDEDHQEKTVGIENVDQTSPPRDSTFMIMPEAQACKENTLDDNMVILNISSQITNSVHPKEAQKLLIVDQSDSHQNIDIGNLQAAMQDPLNDIFLSQMMQHGLFIERMKVGPVKSQNRETNDWTLNLEHVESQLNQDFKGSSKLEKLQRVLIPNTVNLNRSFINSSQATQLACIDQKKYFQNELLQESAIESVNKLTPRRQELPINLRQQLSETQAQVLRSRSIKENNKREEATMNLIWKGTINGRNNSIHKTKLLQHLKLHRGKRSVTMQCHYYPTAIDNTSINSPFKPIYLKQLVDQSMAVNSQDFVSNNLGSHNVRVVQPVELHLRSSALMSEDLGLPMVNTNAANSGSQSNSRIKIL